MDSLRTYLRVLTPALLLTAASLAGCGGGGGGEGDDDDGGGSADGGGDVDAGPPPCEPTGPETVDGVDNDCDGLLDEIEVCGDGSTGVTTIEGGIAAAADGGIVEVCPGTYEELLTIGKPVRVIATGGRDVTIIDANANGIPLDIADVAAPGVSFEGFTVREGKANVEGGPVRGAGLRCTASTVAIVDGAFLANRAVRGGAIDALGCAIDVSGTHFEGNRASGLGGAINLEDSTGTIAGSSFTDNKAEFGGAVAILNGEIAITGSDLSGNEAVVRGGALYLEGDAAIDDSVIDGNFSNWIGGAIYVRGLAEDFPDPTNHGTPRAPTIANSTITNNTADFEGGAIYSHWGSETVTDSTISFNTATRDDGGGLRLFTASARYERNTIEGNRCGKSGGGVKSSHLATHFIDNVFKNNVATSSGGGLVLDNDSSTLRGGSVTGNTAPSAGGGVHAALWAVNGGSIEDVLIEGNQSDTGAGLFLADHFEPVIVRNVVLRGNAGNRGGGMYTRATPLTMTRTLIVGNTANQGGGLHVAALNQNAESCRPNGCPLDVLAMDFNVIFGNSAPSGAGVYVAYNLLSFGNSIVAGNQNGASVTLAAEVAAPTWRYTLTQPATFEGMADPTGTNGNLSGDPKLEAPGAGDFHLKANSPAVNAGDPALQDEDGSAADLGIYGGPAAP